MNKAKFNVRIRDCVNGVPLGVRLSEVSGYVFMFSGLRFGVSRWSANHWTVTELSTGLKVMDGTTRKDAVDRFLKDRGIVAAIRKVVEENGEDVNPEIVPKTEFLVAR